MHYFRALFQTVALQ